MAELAPFSGVIFDLDGVLADTEPLHARSWQAVYAEQGLQVGVEWFEAWIGIADIAHARHVATEHPDWGTAEALVQRKRHAYQALCRAALRPAPGVAAFLHGPRLPAALCTTSFRSEVDVMLEILGLADSFDAVICGDEVPARKPDPAPYRLAAAALGLPPEQCVVLEDSPAGVASATGAGCQVLGILSSFPEAQIGAAHLLFPSTPAALNVLGLYVRRSLTGAGLNPDACTPLVRLTESAREHLDDRALALVQVSPTGAFMAFDSLVCDRHIHGDAALANALQLLALIDRHMAGAATDRLLDILMLVAVAAAQPVRDQALLILRDLAEQGDSHASSRLRLLAKFGVSDAAYPRLSHWLGDPA